MPLMLVLLAFLIAAVLWGVFHANPPAASRAQLVLCNGAIVVAAVARFLAVYLAIVAGGAALMILLIVGGLLRNLLLFRPRQGSACPR